MDRWREADSPCYQRIMSHWWLPVLGGVLMGVASGLVLLVNGRLPGVSGLLASLVGPDRSELAWRAAFVAGLVTGGAVLVAVRPAAIPIEAPPLAVMLVAGALVGAGARYAGGCTSGHGLLGVGRLSGRSMVATLVFMGAGMVTVTLVRHWMRGGA
jgi:uncharacterized membrane protein YedE/YeeE